MRIDTLGGTGREIYALVYGLGLPWLRQLHLLGLSNLLGRRPAADALAVGLDDRRRASLPAAPSLRPRTVATPLPIQLP